MASVASRKRMILAGWVIAAVVAVVAITDLALAFPFHRQPIMDILFLVGAGIVGFMAFDAYKDVR